MKMPFSLPVRIAAWTCALGIALAWRYWPMGEQVGHPMPQPPPQEAVRDTRQLVIREALPKEWALSLAELGEKKVARRVCIIPAGSGSLPIKGQLLRYDSGSGPQLAYIADPSEPQAVLVTAELFDALRSKKAFVYCFGEEQPLTPDAMLEMPMNTQLPSGWSAVYAPGTNLD